jgi:hypothetical protein
MVGQRRQAWCPRCDELRSSRPGSPCPVCSASLLALPQGSRTAAWRGGRDAVAERLRSLLPAARVVAVAAVALALVAGGFTAGHFSRPSRTASAAAPATTRPAGRALAGGGFSTDVSRVFRWNVLRGGLTLTLHRITATGSATRIVLGVSGLEPEWTFGGVIGLRLTDSAGRQLAVGTPDEALPTDEVENLGGGSMVGTLTLGRRIDPNGVAGVTVARVIEMRRSSETLRGTLVDAELKRQMDSSPQQALVRKGACSGCSLALACVQCETVRVAGTSYRDGRVVVLLSQSGRPASGQSLADADISVSTGGPGGQVAGGQVGSFEDSADGGDTVVEFDARDLAASTPRRQQRMPFEVVARVMRSELVAGPWQLDQRGGQR